MNWIGIIAALASAACWALATVIFDRIGKVMPSVCITFFKGAFSIILMVILILFTGGLQPIGSWEFSFLALSGIIGIAIGDSVFFMSLRDLGAKIQVIFFLLGQVLTLVLSLLFLGELLTLIQYIGSSILLSGVTVMTWGKQENHPNKKRGILLGLISIACFSVSAIMVKAAIGNVEVVTATFYRMVFGTLFTMGIGIVAKQFKVWVSFLKNRKLLGLFILNTIIITYGGFLLSTLAIKDISVALASILGATEPIFVLIFVVFINKEKVTKRELLGAFITISGLILIL